MKKPFAIIIAIPFALLAGCRGPQGKIGPQGPIGFQGDKGPQGERGATGPSLKVVDYTNAEVGYLIYSDFDNKEIFVFDSNINKLVYYDYDNGEPLSYRTEYRNIYFISDDCSGQPLSEYISNPYMLVRPGSGEIIYSPMDYADIFLDSVTVNSKLEYITASRDDSDGFEYYLNCVPTNEIINNPAQVYEVLIPSYEGPLRIVIE